MEWFEALILGGLQGVSEFLPISSSGHLVLGEEVLGLEVEELKSFDVFVHVGTLAAILVYFWRDIWGMLINIGKNNVYGRLLLYILIGTVPAVIVGLLAEGWIDGVFRNVNYVAGAMFVVGLMFIMGEQVYKKRGKKADLGGMTWWKALFIGCFQAVALIPGVSRSGSTIVAGLFQGIKREEAARFSFLLGIPAIAGAGLLTAIKENGEMTVEWLPTLIGFGAAFIFGLISVSILMKFLKKYSLRMFAVYLILLSLLIFLVDKV